MNIRVVNEGETSTVFLSGSIDIPSAEDLKHSLQEQAEQGAKKIIVDFTEVDSIGSSGIGAFLLCHKEFVAKGIDFAIVNINKEIKALFKIIKLDKIFKI
ncbi:MAG: STAS domain-containing protein [bacterium]|nr:STAS domain-containing protein [bacterium]